MIDLLSKIPSLAKIPSIIVNLPPAFLALACLITVTSVFPDKWIQALRLEGLINDYGEYLRVAFYVTLSLIAIRFVGYSLKRGQVFKQSIATEKAVISSLTTLDPHEKAVLREFCLQRKNTIMLPRDKPAVAGLLQKHIISVVYDGHGRSIGRSSFVGQLLPFRLSDLASPLIKENPILIGFPPCPLTQEQMQRLENSRPGFVRRMERFDY